MKVRMHDQRTEGKLFSSLRIYDLKVRHKYSIFQGSVKEN